MTNERGNQSPICSAEVGSAKLAKPIDPSLVLPSGQ
jgi:hypothetical protein